MAGSMARMVPEESVELLGSQDWTMRCAALEAMSQLEPSALAAKAPVIVQRLEDAHSSVRQAATADMRTQAPTIRHSTFKMGMAVGKLKSMRRRDFDVDAAYLQGKFVGQRVWARSPDWPGVRLFDERGIELVWRLGGPLYGEPDAGRLWYNTWVHFCTVVESFNRAHYDPCLFYYVSDEPATIGDDKGKELGRINLTVYVDDGHSWDNIPRVCDDFYVRLSQHFAVTMDAGGLKFSLGMDIVESADTIMISSYTFIKNLCEKRLPKPLDSYAAVHVPGHPKLMEYYEAAFLQRGGVVDPGLSKRYNTLVGELQWPAPTTRIDALFAVGILARARTFPTEDLYTCGLRVLVYLGQTMARGITYSRHAHDGRRLWAAADSDWGVRRSTSGGCSMLAGGSVNATSKRQECIAGSSGHAEIIALSSLSNEVEWERGLLQELGLPQHDATVIEVDSTVAEALAQDYTSNAKTRHIERRNLVIRERVAAIAQKLRHVASKDNIADMFTKVLDRVPFESLYKRAMQVLRAGYDVATLLTPNSRRHSLGRDTRSDDVSAWA